jgi:hypothetical protein
VYRRRCLDRTPLLALAALLSSTAALSVAASSTAQAPLTGSITGVVTNPDGSPSYGTEVEAVQSGIPCPAGYTCGVDAVSEPSGRYTIANLYPGTYEIEALDAGTTISEASVDVTGSSTSTVNVGLPPAPVPSGTVAHNAARDLSLLNRLRATVGLPAGIVLNSRWATECAAHDVYEHENDVLEHPENPKLRGASTGGAWAGENSILAEYRWTGITSPWWTAPIHLIQLLTPSLSVIGIDNTDGFQCATTWPGMLRAPVEQATIFTYPGQRARNVPPSENADESPFVPGQFVGIPDGRTAGRELFVYLNLPNETGQAQVKILDATLAQGRHAVSVRWVDNSTKTLGPYLTGGILLPVKPMRRRTRYTATVVVQHGSGSLRHSWSFTTA